MDSSATVHLIGSSELFVYYVPCAGNKTIKIVDGSLATIVEKEEIYPCAGLSLHHVLHVLKISYIMLSISKITCDLNCKATFLPDSAFFQDLSSLRMIGTAQSNRGLYLLDDDISSRTRLLSSYFTTSK